MQSGAIPDERITASSMHGQNYAPARARLGLVKYLSLFGAWSAHVNDTQPWIQVDLVNLTTVTSVATQGRSDVVQWVKTYSLQYGWNLTHFVDYGNGTIFTGNSDQNTVVTNVLDPPITARYIRLLPKTWEGHISLRLELYGCPKGISNFRPMLCYLPAFISYRGTSIQ
jgi:hypothetical protein